MRGDAREADGLVELPTWVKRVQPDAHPVARKRTLSDHLRDVAGDREDVIDVAALEEDIERLRTEA